MIKTANSYDSETDMPQFSIRISNELKDQIYKSDAAEEVSVTSFVRRAICYKLQHAHCESDEDLIEGVLRVIKKFKNEHSPKR